MTGRTGLCSTSRGAAIENEKLVRFLAIRFSHRFAARMHCNGVWFTPAASMRWCRSVAFASACRSLQRSRWSLLERRPKSRPRPFHRRLETLDEVDLDGRRLRKDLAACSADARDRQVTGPPRSSLFEVILALVLQYSKTIIDVGHVHQPVRRHVDIV